MVSSSSVVTLIYSSLALHHSFGFIPSIITCRSKGHHRRRNHPISKSSLQPTNIGGLTVAHVSAAITTTDVQVYDNVFSPEVCEVLRCLALEGTVRRNSEDTCLFLRPPYNVTDLTPLEHAMDSALTALKDPCRTVEYWSRDEHMNLRAHVDIDEIELGENGKLRAPSAAHVLYLSVKPDLKGPTCVFPSQRLGWSNDDESNADIDLVTIPAVVSRLLRFPGDAVHAVPCPADRWLLSEEEENNLRMEEMLEEEEEEGLVEEYEDVFDDEDTDVERAVLLFNTWPNDKPPPTDVDMDYADESDTVEERVAEWNSDYGIDSALLRCHPKEEWNEQSFLKEPHAKREKDAIARVNLMGGQDRRLLSEDTAKLHVQEKILRRAVNQQTHPTWLCLQQE